MKIKHFFDKDTSTFTYVIVDEETNKSAIIDSVLNYNQYSGGVSTKSADEVISYITTNNLQNEWILETHIHADHITAASYLKKHVGGKTAIGSRIKEVLEIWVEKFETQKDTLLTGKQFDFLFQDGAKFKIGNINIDVLHTPGHTPACVSYVVQDCVFVGDTIFSPTRGTARCDFPGGSAKTLFESIQKFYQMPDSTKLYLCHDYPNEGEDLISSVTVGEQKKFNSMIKHDTSLEEYILKRETRDKTLQVPKLLLPSIQANMRLGDFGSKSKNNKQFIHIPINALK